MIPSAARDRSARTSLLWSGLILGLVGTVVSCQHFGGTKPKVTARLLEGGKSISMIVSSRDRDPARFLHGGGPFVVEFASDPYDIDVLAVATYSLWGLDEDGWHRLASTEPGERRLTIELGDGVHALRGSATLKNGTEMLNPSTADVAAAWLYIDTQAPEIAWRAPGSIPDDRGPPVGVALDADGGYTVSLESPRFLLRWTTTDAQLSNEPSRIEWSGDAGVSWKTISEIPAARGENQFAWEMPEELPPAVLVRVTASDALGRESSARLPLRIVRGIDEPGPATSVEVAPIVALDGGSESGAPASDGASGDEEVDAPNEVASAAASGDEGDEGDDGAVDGSDASQPGATTAVLETSVGGGADRERIDDATPTPSSASTDVAGPFSDDALANDRGAAVTAGSGASGAAAKRTTSPPRPGGKTAAGGVGAPVGSGPVVVHEPGTGCVRGGETVRVRFDVAATVGSGGDAAVGLGGDTAVRLESRSDDFAWTQVAEGRIRDGGVDWTVPKMTGECSYRLIVGGGIVAQPAAPLRIDSTAPVISIERASTIVGPTARFPVRSTGEGCAELAGARAYLRAEGQRNWNVVPDGRVTLDGSDIVLDLRYHGEGSYDLYLAGIDTAGNMGPAASVETKPMTRFALDRTPPRIAGKDLIVDWVGGFQGEILLDIDAAELVQPLIVDGREPKGEFREIVRLESLTLPQGKVGFPVPTVVDAYEVRATVRDVAGNTADVVFGPREVKKAVAFRGFAPGMALVGGAQQRIDWDVHPVALEYKDELQAALEHQPAPGGSWVALTEGLAPDRSYYWDLPTGDDAEHRLRVTLYRRGEAVARDLSPPFRIYAVEPQGQPNIDISRESVEAYDEASIAYARYSESEGRVSPEEATRLGRLAEEKFMRAIVLDQRNYRAKYDLSMLLWRRTHRSDDTTTSTMDDVIHWLESTIAVAPRHAGALRDLGGHWVARGDGRRAETYLLEAQSVEPSAAISYNLGLAYLLQSKPADARKALTTALDGVGTDVALEADIHYAIISSWLAEGDVAKARAVFASVTDRLPPAHRAELEASLASR